MRLGTARRNGGTRAFAQVGSSTVWFEAADVGELIRDSAWRDLAGTPGEAPDHEQLVMPIRRPGKIICVGLNYHDHAAEVGKVAPTVPTLFMKVATSLVGPADDIILPSLSEEIDWEAELAIVIGERVRNADDVSALSSILGYSVFNDISARDWQRRTTEWFQGKNFDSTSPFGPVIVTGDEIDPAAGLAIECEVNGEITQSGSTSNMIFSAVELVKYISQFLTLEPGDVIASGTPAGVGFVREPPIFLSAGQRVITRIEGIGMLVNLCVSDSQLRDNPITA